MNSTKLYSLYRSLPDDERRAFRRLMTGSAPRVSQSNVETVRAIINEHLAGRGTLTELAAARGWTYDTFSKYRKRYRDEGLIPEDQ